jgi:hypothetical protein
MRPPLSLISLVRIFFIAIALFLLLFGLLWLFSLRYIKTGNEIIYNSPILSIRYIQIRPDDLVRSSLVRQSITITNAETIQQIMTAIRSAQPYEPNHDPGMWSCELVISNLSGEGGICVVKELNGGTIIGESRSSALGNILERIAKQGGVTNQ